MFYDDSLDCDILIDFGSAIEAMGSALEYMGRPEKEKIITATDCSRGSQEGDSSDRERRPRDRFRWMKL